MKNNQAYRLFLEIEEEKRGHGEIWPAVYTLEILSRYQGLTSTMVAELNEAEAAEKMTRCGVGRDERWRS